MINNLSGKDLMMALFLQESIEICNFENKILHLTKSVGFREDQENGKYE
ncbi:hypothetical protein [Chryseobacterium bernardetii]|nr:hypothetical protein [Chryseobacterium bernardetii]